MLCMNKQNLREKLEENGFSLEETLVILSFDDLEKRTPEPDTFNIFNRKESNYVLDDEGRKDIFAALGNRAMFVEFAKDAKQDPTDSGNYYYDLDKALDREVRRYSPSEISGV
jgi:hypothetical protein